VGERGKLALSFAMTLAVLCVSAEFCLPHWLSRFLDSLQAYAATETDPSILQALFPGWVAVMLSAILLGAVVLRAWRTRASWAGSDQFGETLALVASCTIVLIPKIAAYNQLLLVPALLLLLSKWNELRSSGVLARSAIKAVFVCQIWQWAAAVSLATASLLIRPGNLRGIAPLPLATLLALPVLTAAAVLIMTSARSEPERR